jgi:large subunit ribosomal protein L9
MKIILKEDFSELGHIGEVIKVADGYARNYLIPKGIAVNATSGNLKQFESMKEAILKKQAKFKESADELCKSLAAVKLTYTRKAGDDNKLFGSVTNKEIAASLKEKGFEIDRKAIHISEHVKHLGDFNFSVKLHKEVIAELTATVVKEAEAGEKASEKAEEKSE